MNILTISNLYPRPDQPQRGLFNHDLFGEMAVLLAGKGEIRNVCLVPEWRIWRHRRIISWDALQSYKVHTRFIPVSYIPVIGRNIAPTLYERSYIRHYKDDYRPDVVYSSWLYPDGVAASLIAAKMGLPHWMMVLGSDICHLEDRNRRRLILNAIDSARGVICVAQHLKDKLIEYGADRNKVRCCPNGVDKNLFMYRNRDDILDGLGKQELKRRRIVLFVGNLVHVKGPDILLESWRHVIHERNSDDYRLMIVGDGEMRADLEKIAESYGIMDSVLFMGSRPQAEVASWMNVADCLCLTSRSEGMPNVVLESIASGLPVVSTDIFACRELIGKRKESRLIDLSGDLYQKFSDAIISVCKQTVDRQMLAEKAGVRTRAEQAKEIMKLLFRK